MASYQIKQRDPLLDTKMQAALERRGKELLGLAIAGLGLLMALLLASYSPSDPSWLTATDQPVHNWLGRIGAAVASPLYVIVGWGSWGIALALIAWGVRFATHRGEERALGRVVFAPIAIALMSVYASTNVPSSAWTHSFGLGGMFGDTALAAVLGILPLTADLGLKVMAFLSGALMLGVGLFALGFTRPEIKSIARFLLLGLVVIYAIILKSFRKVATAMVSAGQALYRRNQIRRERASIRREEAAQEAAREPRGPAVIHGAAHRARFRGAAPDVQAAAPTAAPDPLPADDPTGAPPPARAGLLARMPSLMKRQPVPEPELVEPEPLLHEPMPEGSEERIKAKIADVIKSRVRQTPTLQVARPEPQVTRGRGPQPLVLDTQPPLQTAPLSETADVIAPDQVAATTARPVVPTAAAPRPVVQHAPVKPLRPSRKAQAEAQPALQFEERHTAYESPPLSLLTNPIEIQRHHLSDESLEENARMLESVLDDYGVKGEIVSVRPGPVVTMYELEPAPGLKASRVIGLAYDIARSMSALSARVSTVPGRSVIGIELPNVNREKVVLREILSARDFGDSNMRLPLALGKDIGGDPVVANLAKMPHLLIAGTTGSGKSVAINTMILSLLYKLTPEECRLIMIDPKMLELSVYDGIPHLLSPVVTDPRKAVVALKWVVGEMEERYRKMSKMGVRNIDGYNGRVRDALSKDELFSRTVQTGFADDTGEPVFETEEFAPEILPYIVVIVDEMADLMMVAGKEIEACIQRLA